MDLISVIIVLKIWLQRCKAVGVLHVYFCISEIIFLIEGKSSHFISDKCILKKKLKRKKSLPTPSFLYKLNIIFMDQCSEVCKQLKDYKCWFLACVSMTFIFWSRLEKIFWCLMSLIYVRTDTKLTHKVAYFFCVISCSDVSQVFYMLYLSF